MSKAYSNNYCGTQDNTNCKASLVTRDYVFRNGYFVIHDRATAANANFSKAWHLHVPNVPQVNTGSFITPPAGINNYSASEFRSDNGTGRLWAKVVLPSSPDLRVVGGNNCTANPVTAATNANPAQLTTQNPHGLSAGDWLGITFASSSGSGWHGDSGIDTNNLNVGNIQVASVVNATQFTVSHANAANVNSTSFGALVDSPSVSYVGSCGYEGHVDDLGTTPGTPNPRNLWWPANFSTGITQSAVPKWRVDVKPASAQATDYFLTVLYPTTTSTSTFSSTTAIDSASVSGVVINDANPTIAVFPKDAAPQTSITYDVTCSGNPTHVVTGLAAGSYTVTQGGAAVVTNQAVGSDGALSFSSTGCSTFVIAGATVAGGSSLSGPVSLSGAGTLR